MRFYLADAGPLKPGDSVAAVVLVDDGRYLLQLRDDKAGIFFPGYWGLFGGAIEEGETEADALRRELKEELGVTVTQITHLMRFEFNLAPMGRGTFIRSFFELRLTANNLSSLRLMEGERIGVFSKPEVLKLHPVTPFDAFAIWCHASSARINAK